MKRRVLLSCAAGAAVAASALVGVGAATSGAETAGHGTTATRPNIVFVLTDDLSMNLLRHMPHVQAMQAGGTTLSRYHVVDSLCCPSRTAIFTGQYPHDNGVFTNKGADGGYDAYNRNGDAQKSFALALQKSGYRTGFMGKYLNGYEPTDPIPPGWSEWDVAGNGYPEFNYDLNENGTVRHYGKRPQDYLTDVVSRKGSAFIRSSNKPFALEIATFAPHGPYTPAPRDVGSARGIAYPKTPAYNTMPTNAPSWLKGRAPLTGKQQQSLLADYRKRVSAVRSVDEMIGNLQAALRAKGVAKNTYVVFSSDNGYHMGEYRLLAGKQTAYDTDTHVPLVVTGPGVAAGRSTSRLASNIDLAPTFEKITRTTVGTHVDGVDLSPLWSTGTPRRWQQGILIEHHGPNNSAGDPDRQNAKHANPPSYEAVRTATALYVEYGNGQREYYDTRADPYQLHNVAARGVPAYLPRMLHALEQCHGSVQCQRAAGG